MTYVIAIGDRSYSSWSLRAWLMFEHFGLPVTLRHARLYSPEIEALRAEFGARTVPALRVEEGGRSYSYGTRSRSPRRWPSAARTSASGPPIRRRGHWPGASRPRCTPASRHCATPAA
jgi:hypothetical protein